MIADVVFDLPTPRAFSYAIPSGMSLQRGQRVRAPLRRHSRIGIVVALRDGADAGLEAIERVVDSGAILSSAALEVGSWAAEESLSSWGSTLMAFLPPPARRRVEEVAPAAEFHPAGASTPELWVGSAREDHLIERLRRSAGSALVIAPDRVSAARWAQRLEALRLDSGASEAARRAAWFAAARGRARIVTGTRSALLAPLPPPATLVLVDEHDSAHKPPGAPRLHSRELLLRRSLLEGSRFLMLSGTPSVESWWRAQEQHAIRVHGERGPWPLLIPADTRGILPNHPLTLPLTRAIEEASRRDRRVALIVTRRAATLLCTDCGAILRCADCAVPLEFSRARRALSCRICGRGEPLPDHCPSCHGHRLLPFGWDAERVEAAVRRRFPKLTVSREDPRAQALIGAASILKVAAPGTFDCVGIVALDRLLSVPDFRGGERAFELLWAAAEATSPRGRVIVQTLHPEHYAIEAVKMQDLETFYQREVKLRAELGYPPFRRLCALSVTGPSDEARNLAEQCLEMLRGIEGLTVYPPAPIGGVKNPRWQLVVKGPQDLPRIISPLLAPLLERRRRRGGIVRVEMDP
jgi:primosomal protein N' (replication factor Y) (superfamily II helicase)